MISKLQGHDYDKLFEIWEGTVKATHDFLSPEDFEYYKSRIPVYFKLVDLYAYYDENLEIKGFLGMSGSMIEMLFVEDAFRGKGIGSQLLNYAVDRLEATKVDVNLQNEKALLFYKHFGFEEIGLSEHDSEGKAYPILHLGLLK